MRSLCRRCFRPTTVCACALLTPVPTRTRLVILQHPREAKVAIGTARMAHLALPNSELLEGIDFDGDPRVEALCASAGAALVFPGPGALPLESLQTPPATLVVVDGTWAQARQLVNRNRSLQRLTRVSFAPERPSNYRIRREPDERFVSTIEAVVEVLARLEGPKERFTPLLAAFERMVDTQLACARARNGPARFRVRLDREPGRGRPRALLDAWDGLVLLYAESNSFEVPDGARRIGQGASGHELVQLLAHRPSTGETLELRIAPRRPLAEGAPGHLELP
ncbi:MAG: tRNA-uridine aminocarboxypropyltransferase, partial [Myxococcales bacterium]